MKHILYIALSILCIYTSCKFYHCTITWVYKVNVAIKSIPYMKVEIEQNNIWGNKVADWHLELMDRVKVLEEK